MGLAGFFGRGRQHRKAQPTQHESHPQDTSARSFAHYSGKHRPGFPVPDLKTSRQVRPLGQGVGSADDAERAALQIAGEHHVALEAIDTLVKGVQSWPSFLASP